MNFHFYLESKKLKNSEKSIYLFIRGLHKSKSLAINTGEKINPILWDKNLEQAINEHKGKNNAATNLNDFLNTYKENVARFIREVRRDKPDADFNTIKTYVLEKLGKSNKTVYTFFDALDLFITTRKKDLSYDSIRKFTTIKNHLKSFEKKERITLTFEKINLLFYDKFLNFLLYDKKMVNNSAYKIIGLFKIFLKWSFDRGINPNLTFQKFKVKEEKVDIITLNEEEFGKIADLDLSDNKRLERARDLFLFGCYTGGRFRDLSKIEPEDLRDDVWYLRVKKTRDILEIPLLDQALEIIEKYKGDGALLPRISNQKLNAYIKEVGALAKIEDPIKVVRYRGSEPIVFEGPKYEFITVHTARRTFITQSLLRGMKAEIIMSITGHKNFRTFKKYLDITRKDKKEELRKAWANQLNLEELG